jgi:hypothetical protein
MADAFAASDLQLVLERARSIRAASFRLNLGLQRLRKLVCLSTCSCRFSVLMILKMNFNFNFKDIAAASKASIRRPTTA